jgi:hypothetical protein
MEEQLDSDRNTDLVVLGLLFLPWAQIQKLIMPNTIEMKNYPENIAYIGYNIFS